MDANPGLDIDYLRSTLLELLAIPSPTGFTDEAVRYTCAKLEELDIPYEITRRGAIRADLKGEVSSPDRAIVAHLDTIGAMVKSLKPTGRVEVMPVGTWSARFAAGARVTIFTDRGPKRGTLLPLKASGHTYDAEVDTQPTSWHHLELRIDEPCVSLEELVALGVNVGDYIAVDPQPELTDSGYLCSRHLDDKAGVAAVLTVAKALRDDGANLPLDCHLLFTISEEVGSGASHILHGDVAEMVTIDTAPAAPGQNSSEHCVTIGMMDSSGPFDYHLSHKLIGLCDRYGIPMRRDVFRYYHSDSASAIEAGNDIRTALVCFGTDATHGWERTHRDALVAMCRLLYLYATSEAAVSRDRHELGPIEGFPRLPSRRDQ